jgi:hypothetical protein
LRLDAILASALDASASAASGIRGQIRMAPLSREDG